MFGRRENDSITICFLSHSSGIAGAEKAFPKLLEGLQEKGIRVNVLLPSSGPVITELKQRNISFDIVNYPRWLNEDSKLLKRIKRTLKNMVMIIPTAIKIYRWKCDIVYTNTSTICVGAFAAKLLRLPHIWHFREFGSEDYGYSYDLGNKISQWLTNKLSTVCLTNSIAVCRKYQKFIPSSKLKVLYESYKESDLDNNDAENIILKKSDLNCIMIGTLHEAKGHKDAIKAINLLLKLGRNIKLFIVGSGYENYKKDLSDLIKHMDIEESVEFLGYLKNPKFVMKQCDILLMCSRNEAFGLVTLEAMQAGIPVIGTRSGGTVELITDNVNGLLYTPGKYKELAEKLEILYDNHDRIKEMGNYSKQLAVERFSYSQYILETLKVLTQVVSGKQ